MTLTYICLTSCQNLFSIQLKNSLKIPEHKMSAVFFPIKCLLLHFWQNVTSQKAEFPLQNLSLQN